MNAATFSRTVVSGMALVILGLAGQVAFQAMRLSAATSELQQARRDLEFTVDQLAREKLHGRRDEMVRVINWLDDFYRSPEGLERPAGLWQADANKIDGEAIAVWVLDVYLSARLNGASEESAREAVVGQIKATDEWQRRHSVR